MLDQKAFGFDRRGDMAIADGYPMAVAMTTQQAVATSGAYSVISDMMANTCQPLPPRSTPGPKNTQAHGKRLSIDTCGDPKTKPIVHPKWLDRPEMAPDGPMCFKPRIYGSPEKVKMAPMTSTVAETLPYSLKARVQTCLCSQKIKQMAFCRMMSGKQHDFLVGVEASGVPCKQRWPMVGTGSVEAIKTIMYILHGFLW